MTKDDIIRMAQQAYEHCDHIPNLKIPKEFIERFAQLVATAEREACAKVCEEETRCEECGHIILHANQIRARGQQ